MDRQRAERARMEVINRELVIVCSGMYGSGCGGAETDSTSKTERRDRGRARVRRRGVRKTGLIPGDGVEVVRCRSVRRNGQYAVAHARGISLADVGAVRGDRAG